MITYFDNQSDAQNEKNLIHFDSWDKGSRAQPSENETYLLQTSLNDSISNIENQTTPMDDILQHAMHPKNSTTPQIEEIRFEPCSDWLVSFWNRLLLFIFYQVQKQSWLFSK